MCLSKYLPIGSKERELILLIEQKFDIIPFNGPIEPASNIAARLAKELDGINKKHIIEALNFWKPFQAGEFKKKSIIKLLKNYAKAVEHIKSWQTTSEHPPIDDEEERDKKYAKLIQEIEKECGFRASYETYKELANIWRNKKLDIYQIYQLYNMKPDYVKDIPNCMKSCFRSKYFTIGLLFRDENWVLFLENFEEYINNKRHRTESISNITVFEDSIRNGILSIDPYSPLPQFEKPGIRDIAALIINSGKLKDTKWHGEYLYFTFDPKEIEYLFNEWINLKDYVEPHVNT